MRPYDLGVFVHVMAAVGLFVALAFEALAVARLRHAETSEDAGSWLGVLAVSGRVGPVAWLAVVVAGLYLSVSAWSWDGWIVAGLAGWLLIGALGEPLPRADRRALAAAAARGPGPLDPALRAVLRAPRPRRSVAARGGVAVAIVLVMTTKPGLPAAAAIVLVGAVAGPAAVRGGSARRPRLADG